MNLYKQQRIDFENKFKKYFFCYYKLIDVLKEMNTVEHYSYMHEFCNFCDPLKSVKNKEFSKFKERSDFACFLNNLSERIYWNYIYDDSIIIEENCYIFGDKNDGLWMRIYSPSIYKYKNEKKLIPKYGDKILDKYDKAKEINFDKESYDFLYSQRLEIFKKIKHPVLFENHKKFKFWILVADEKLNITDKTICR